MTNLSRNCPVEGALLEALATLSRERTVGAEQVPDVARLASRLAGARVVERSFSEAGVVGRPPPTGLWAWHRDCLLDSLRLHVDSESRARRAFHARWLLHLLQPCDSGADLLASVIIPVHDRAHLVVEAVESAINQRRAQVEVIVVDDGSSDHPEIALRPYLSRIHLSRQRNRGVASARNRGLAAAKGDYVCFLDSDNLLDADAVATCIDIFHAIPDADLCFALPRNVVVGSLQTQPAPKIGPDGSVECATSDLLRAALAGNRLLTLGTLLPRWRALDVGGFDERLRKGEDSRFWFQLGLRDAKAVGIARPFNTRRRFPGSLSDDLGERSRRSGFLNLLYLIDLLGRPDRWNLLGRSVAKLTALERWDWVCTTDEPALVRERDRLLIRLRELAARGSVAGLSERPVLALLRFALRAAAARLWPHDEQPPAFHAQVLAVVDDSSAVSPAPRRADVEYWHRDPTLFGDLSPALDTVRRDHRP